MKRWATYCFNLLFSEGIALESKISFLQRDTICAIPESSYLVIIGAETNTQTG